MTTKLTMPLSLAAGLAGGILSQYIAPALVHAQAQTPMPKEIRAQSFTLVDASGNRVGALAIGQNNRPVIWLKYRDADLFIDPMLAMQKNSGIVPTPNSK
jgi:hypothetical protein